MKEVIVVLEEVEAEIEGEKRQSFPYIVKARCPNCGRESSIDLRDHFLSNPLFGSEEQLGFYCYGDGGCEYEWFVTVIPRLVLELVER